MTLPHSPDAEGALLARLLADPAQVPLVDLPPEDIYDEANRKAFTAMVQASREGRTVDISLLDGVVDVRVLTPYHSAPLDEYVRRIRSDAARRRMITALDHVIRMAYESDNQQAILAELQDAVTTITRGVEQGSLISPEQAVEDYHRVLTMRQKGEGLGLPYGFPALDAILHPALGGEMIIVAARPSVGKTSLAEHIARTWATAQSQAVLFCSLEMSTTQLMDRAISRDAHIPAQRVIRGQLTDAEREAARDALDNYRHLGIWKLDDPMATTATVRAVAAKVKLVTGGLAGIIVDYMQILHDAGDAEVQRVTRISRNLKAIAREYDVPLLALSQLNRALEGREDKHPQLHDLRESGAIEQDADVVLGLYRPLGTNDMDVDILKARQGGLGRALLYFEPDYVRFL